MKNAHQAEAFPTEDASEVWTMSDQANSDLVNMKYSDRDKLGQEWVDKHKAAEASKTREDGKPNPHYPRMAMEATLARMAFDMAYVVSENLRLRREMDILAELYSRVGIIEDAYAHLRSSTEQTKAQYRDSLRKSLEERRESSTVAGMLRAGMNPDNTEDRLRWARKLDEVTAAAFAPHTSS